MKKFIISLAIVAMMATLVSTDTQIFKTALKVTILDDLGNIQQGAKVRLFESEADYKAETNAILPEEQGTDKKGVIWFRDIPAKAYWILAENGDLNNWSGGVKTGALEKKKINKINIIIE